MPDVVGPQYEIPSVVVPLVKTEVAGKDRDDTVAVISVPASTVPTVIRIYHKSKTIRQVIVPEKHEPQYPISVVSDNPEVTLTVPERTPWWHWAIGILGAGTLAWEVLSRIFSVIAGPIGLIRRLIK